MTTTTAPPPTLAERVDALAWPDLEHRLDARGFAVTEPVLDLAECRDLSDLFDGGRFPTQHRPQLGARGHHRVGLRHGVSTVTCGRRTALGIIFHDAR